MTRNLDALDRVAAAIELVGVRYAFVAGATIELFLDALGQAQARVADDVDCIVDVTDRGTFYALEVGLRRAGFVNSVVPGDPNLSLATRRAGGGHHAYRRCCARVCEPVLSRGAGSR